MEELKECPFCGGIDELTIQIWTTDREGTPQAILCGQCGAVGPWLYVDNQKMMQPQIIRAWNERW